MNTPSRSEPVRRVVRRTMRLLAVAALVAPFGAPAPAIADGSAVQKVIADDGAANDELGGSVAVSGDTAVVGARRDDNYTGAAYVYRRTAGVWAKEQKLTGTTTAEFRYFGNYVAVDADTIAVGAWGDAEKAQNAGAVHVFTRTGTTWTQQQKLFAPDFAAGDRFGYSVAVSGDTLVAGATEDDAATGSIYVFTRSGGTWTFQQKLTATPTATTRSFGWAVAIEGDVIVCGTPNDDVTATNAGGAWVFRRSAGVWTQEARLQASDGVATGFFGAAVAISGDTVLAGSWGDNAFVGSAYVYVRNGGTWSEQQKLTGFNRFGGQYFGVAVGLEGDTAVIGAPGDNEAASIAGCAYVFTRTAGVWTGKEKLIPADPVASEFYGVATAYGSGTLVIGANGDDDKGAGSGSAYIADVAPLTVVSDAFALTTTAPYVGQLAATGGRGPYAWTVTSGTVPFNGGTVPTSGVLDGAIGATGPYTFSVGLTDTTGRTASRALTASVNPIATITTPRLLPTAVRGRTWFAPLAATGGTTAYTWTSALPFGSLAIDPQLGWITGPVASDAAPLSGQFDVTLTDASLFETTSTFEFRLVSLVDFPARKTTSAKTPLVLTEVATPGRAEATVALELVRGTQLSATVALAKGRPRPVVFELRGTGGAEVPTTDFTRARKSQADLVRLPIPATDRYLLTIAVVGGDGLSYPVQCSVTAPTRAKGPLAVVAAQTTGVTVGAMPRSKVTVSAKASNGSSLRPTIVSIRDGDGTELLDLSKVKDGGKTATVTVTTVVGGDLTVQFAGLDGSAGAGSWTATIKKQKGYEFALPNLVSGASH